MKAVNISSRKNQIVKEASALLDSSENRRRAGAYLIEGARLIEDAAKSGTKILRLFYTSGAYEKYGGYISAAREKCEEEFVLEPHVSDLLSSTKSSQGVFAVCSMPAENRDLKPKGKIVVLENIQDPSNMGTMLRTAEAMGINTIVLSGSCCDIYSPKVLRGSMGAVFRLCFVHIAAGAAGFLKSSGYKVYGSVPYTWAEKITDIDFTETSAVIIGNEGSGITEETKEECDLLITIPMKGRAESLNAATAAAVIMWEMVK